MTNYEWGRCTVEQWEKKVEISIQNGNMSDAIKYADLANCRDMANDGVDPEQIQNRFGVEL